ncbi:hypothetical protein [Pseudonocardia sp. HH130630-07]|uniref:hypothetical protein n=1 Tax=Pseudonocardia sp. HH130630-07 TaxID=1690815 RepID=UPI000814DADE|nr:hypothetical protein [Pseudonocardia sp. HH130630-07]ANY10617.1 hypothetical protein AFB00_29870 [Pseudonocardia sp. HH130630-07]
MGLLSWKSRRPSPEPFPEREPEPEPDELTPAERELYRAADRQAAADAAEADRPRGLTGQWRPPAHWKQDRRRTR